MADTSIPTPTDRRVIGERPDGSLVQAWEEDAEDDDTDVRCGSCGHVHPDHLRCREPAIQLACDCAGCPECLTDEVSCIRGSLVRYADGTVACGSCADYHDRELGHCKPVGLAPGVSNG